METGVVLLRSRLPVLLAVGTAILLVLFGYHSRGSLPGAWGMLRIPATADSFEDSRMVTYPIDCFLQGKNPYDRQACHPLQSVYDYPPIWLDLRYLGVTSRSSVALGFTLTAMFIGALLLMFDARTLLSAAITFAAVLSRPSLFAVERGNIDLAIISLMIFGFFLVDHQKHPTKQFLTTALIAFLTVLKVYPIATVVVFLRNRRGLRTAVLACAISAAALILTSGRSLHRVFENIPMPISGTYGAIPFFLAMSFHSSLTPMIERHHLIASAGSIVVATLSAITATAYRSKFCRFFPPLNFENARGRIAISCLAIFCFTFLAGAAFGYRLIFLLGVLGYLVSDLNQRHSLRSLPVAIGLLIFLWIPLSRFVVIGQAIDGLAFAVASSWLGSALFVRLEIPESAEYPIERPHHGSVGWTQTE